MVKIETERLILREVTKKDLNNILRQANNLNVSRYLFVVPYPYTKKNACKFVKGCIKNAGKKPRVDYELGIELKNGSGIIGMINLREVEKFGGTGMIGYWLGEDYWRQGIMSEALREIIKFAFNKLKLRRVDISAISENKASNNLIRKLGFVYEGTRRKGVKTKSTGKIYDERIYGLLKGEWKK